MSSASSAREACETQGVAELHMSWESKVTGFNKIMQGVSSCWGQQLSNRTACRRQSVLSGVEPSESSAGNLGVQLSSKHLVGWMMTAAFQLSMLQS